MSNTTDYTKNNINLFDMLPSRHKTNFNRSLFNNTFNRALTKTELTYVSGNIGNTTVNRLSEDSPHRQAFQLQPLVSAIVSTVDYTLSFENLLNELSMIGVDTSVYNQWGDTTVFNYAPPIDTDKLINYLDYYWVDSTTANPIPQYITIKNIENTIQALIYQKERELEQFSTRAIVELASSPSAFVIEGDFTSVFTPYSPFRITGSTSNNGLWAVSESYLLDNKTYIVPTQNISFVGTNYGTINLNVQRTLLRNLLTIYGFSTQTLTTFANTNALNDIITYRKQLLTDKGISSDTLASQDPLLLSLIISNSGTLSTEEQAHFDTFSNYYLNDWSTDNKWKHKLDLTVADAAVGIQAVMPIIEYSHTLELNEWSFTVHKWKHRETVNDPWVETTVQPTLTQLNSPSFQSLWLYVGIDDVYPVSQPELLSSPIELHSINTELNFTAPPVNQLYSFVINNLSVLYGFNDVSVYIDGERQYGNYEEVYAPTSPRYVTGILFDDTIEPQSTAESVTIILGARAQADQGRNIRVVKMEDGSTKRVSLVQYRKIEQVKRPGEIKYPQFNLYNPDGTHSNKTSSLFAFKEDATYSLNTNINKRIVNVGNLYSFVQSMTDSNTLQLYACKDLNSVTTDNPQGFQTIWRTGVTPTTYTPTVVDENRNSATLDNGFWEMPSQWTNNIAHENRIDITSIELLNHFSTMNKQQVIPPTFFSNNQNACRLQFNIDYSVGGTIKEHNLSYDRLISSIFTTANTPVSVIRFGQLQYEGLLSLIRNSYEDTINSLLLETSESYITDLSTSVVDYLINAFETNSFYSQIFGDTTMYNDGVGIKNWVQTLPGARLKNAVHPVILHDETRGVYKLRHHDDHLSDIHIDQATLNDIKRSLINTRIDVSPTRKRGWTPSTAADYGTPESTFGAISYTRLLQNDYWLENNGDLYRFEVVAIQTTPPNPALYENKYYLDSSTGDVYVSDGTSWILDSIENAWTLIDLVDMYASLLLEVETRLYEASKDEEVVWDNDEYNIENVERDFLTYMKSRGISSPYVTDFSASDPFTWNYTGAIPQNLPYTEAASLWAARWHTIYQNIFNTPYPHLEPWRLQGYTDKPIWWDDEYADQTNTRRWSTTMWNRIKQRKIPVGKELPNGTISTNTNFQQPSLQAYSFVCVNISGTTYSGYAPDDLLPPFVSDVNLASYTFINDQTVMDGVDIDAGYSFGEEGPYEWDWKNSAAYYYTQIINGFINQPVRFMHKTWGYDYIDVGYLNIETTLNKVVSHTDDVFHGDVVNNEVKKFKGLNQWYVNQSRYQNNDLKTSDFLHLWKNWEPKYGYQTNSFVDTNSIVAKTKNFEIDSHNKYVVIKRNQAAKTHWLDSLKITVSEYGSLRNNSDIKTPKGDGHDWTFTIDNFINESREISYYGVKDFDFVVSDLEESLLETEGNHTFETGDVVTFYTTRKLPSPLQYYQEYFIIKISDNEFKVADTYEDALIGTYIVLNNIETSGIHRVHSYTQQFYAYGGEQTSEVWFHNEIDKTVINTVSFPFTITGIQNVIDFIDGYSSYMTDDGFVFNHTDVLEEDFNTGTTISWQTEQERFINNVYKGIGVNNTPKTKTIKAHEYTVDLQLNQIVLNNPNISFEDGDEVYIISGQVPPQGLVMNHPYYLITIEPSLGRYKLATTYSNAINNIATLISSIGAGKHYISTRVGTTVESFDYCEVNPFKNNIWINTPTGIVSDVLQGPYEEIKMDYTLYDQHGKVFTQDDIQVYREDTITRVHVFPNLINPDLQVVDETNYNNLHISGWKVYIDEYEHVILFDDYMDDGTLIHDSYLGLYVPYVSIEMDKQTQLVKRPSVGGFILHDGELIRNLEGSVEDHANMFSVYDARETNELTRRARESIGFSKNTNLSLVGSNKKSNFVFWRGAIQQKGSVASIEAFNNSSNYVNTFVDEVWAYKQATFGNITEEQYPRIKMRVTDEFRHDLRYELNYDADGNYQSHFNPIHFNDRSRWMNLPDITPGLPLTNTIRLEADVHSIQTFDTVSADDYVVLNAFCDNVKVYGNNVLLVEGINYRVVTNRLLQFITSHTNVTLYNIVPSRTKHSPMYIEDTVANTVSERPFLWDPARGYHNHKALAYIDLISDANPTKQIIESKISASKDMLFDYATFTAADIHVNTLTVGQRLKETSLVVVNGVVMRMGADYDYTISDYDIVWSDDVIEQINSTDQITVINVLGNGTILIDLQTGADVNNGIVTLPQSMVYVPFTNSIFVMVNGSTLESGVDFDEQDQLTFKLNVELEQDDEVLIMVVNTIIDKYEYDVSSIVDNTIEFEFYHDVYSYLVLINGKILTPGIDYEETAKLTGIVINSDIVLNDITDKITVFANRIIDTTEVYDQAWTNKRVGTVWWNTNSLNYKLYHDPKFFTSTEEQLINWGALGLDSTVELLEWTKSSVPPEEYDALALKQEGDITIPANDRATGTARKFATYNGEFFDERKFKIEFYRATVNNFDDDIIYNLSGIQKQLFVPDANVIVYVNNQTRSWMKLRNFDINDYLPYDLVRIELNIRKITFPRIVVDVNSDKTLESDTGLLPNTVYSFQVLYNKTIYTFTFKWTVEETITYQMLTDYLNGFMPSFLEVEMTDDGNISIKGIKSSPETTMSIVNDLLFKKLTDYVTINDMEAFALSNEYLDNFDEQYDYVEVTRSNNGVPQTEYYFWVSNKKIAQHKRKISLTEMASILTYPTTSYFVLKDFVKTVSDNELLNDRYTSLIVRNLQNQLVVDNRNVLIVTQNKTLRDMGSFRIDTTRKNQHEQWGLFRQHSTARITETLWNKLKDTIVGFKVTDSNIADTNTPVPSYDRVLFDQTNNTATRYGIREGQAFGDKEQLLNTIKQFIMKHDVDTYPVDKFTLITTTDFEDNDSLIEFMDTIYNDFPIKTVNALFFECLMDAVSVQPHLTDLMKTSFISIHTVNTLLDGE